MKRCNNCGWYNHDSATCCEKCEEESFEPVVEETPVAEPEPVKKPEPVIEPEPVRMPEPEPEAVAVPEEKPAKNPMMETVAFGSAQAAPRQQVRKNLAATVMDATAVLRAENENHCPKCRYPIIGFVEYCPNCGATIKNNAEAGAPPVSKVTKIESCDDVAKPLDLKATVRDIPEELVKEDPDMFRLTPVDEPGEASYEMHLGDVIVLGGRRYKFEK